MNKSRVKLFLENFLFYGGLSMLTKALPFITLPIITRLLPNASAYGVVDMFNLINSFGVAIAIMGISDAMFREFFEDRTNIEYQKKITSTGLIMVLFSSTIVFVVTLVLNKQITFLLFKDLKYYKLVILSAFAIGIGGISTIVSSPTRMRNKRRVFLFTGVSFPLVGFIITYILIKIGYTYEAMVYSNLIMSIISLVVFSFLNKKYFKFKLFEKTIAKELLKIGIPLLPTFLIYWIFNSMDRLMINRMLGSTELGIYSIGAKVASISQLVYVAFSGGFSYFKFSTMNDKDQIEMNSKLFEYLGIISFLLFVLSMPFTTIVFNTFFKGDYTYGEKVFGYLFLSPLILMIFQIISSQFLIIKKSIMITLILLFGAILNIILNYYFILYKGIEGAAFSTLISYIIVTIIAMICCKHYNLLIISFKFNVCFLLIVILNILKIYNCIYIEIYSVITFIVIFLLYLKNILKILKGE